MYKVGATVCIKIQQNLCVTLRAEAKSPFLQFCTQSSVVVYFTVENYAQQPIRTSHGLRTGVTQVNNGEPTMR